MVIEVKNEINCIAEAGLHVPGHQSWYLTSQDIAFLISYADTILISVWLITGTHRYHCHELAE